MTGRSAAVVAIVALRCGVSDREMHQTPGNAGARPLMVVRRRRHAWPSAVGVNISGLDVVDGSVRSYGRSMVGPGTGLSGARDGDSALVAVVG